MKKLLFVVIDGGADTPNPELGGKTPFEVAKIPNLNNLARLGMNGLLQVLPIPPESDEAVLALLGYDVFEIYTGRGPLEAIGGGVPFRDGNLALRCNFATVENGEIKDVRAGRISTDEAKELAKAINEFVSIKNAKSLFQSTTGYRGVLIIESNSALSPRISNTHPGYVMEYLQMAKEKGVPMSAALVKPDMHFYPCKPLIPTKEAATAAKLVNEFIEESSMVLEKHPINIERISKGLKPANIILTRDAGIEIPKLFNFSKVYKMNWACLADMPVERGIGQLAGMQIIPIPESTGNAKEDMYIRAQTVLKNISFYDAAYIHLKGPDPYAHVGDVQGKIKAIEDIDKYFFGSLLEWLDLRNTVIVVTCDHTTSCEQKAHTADPVPLVVVGPNIVPDNVAGFNERLCVQGALKRVSAINLMPALVKLVNR